MTKSTDKITFTSPINIDNGFSNAYQGEFESTMELYIHDEDGNACIEWDVPKMNTSQGIGIYCYDGGKIVTDYDGVFEVPHQAIKLLQRNGYDVTYLTDSFDREEQEVFDKVDIGTN